MLKNVFVLAIFLAAICLPKSYANEKEDLLNSIILTKKAKQYYEHIDFNKSLEYAEMAINLNENNIEAYRIMFNIYNFKGSNSKTIEVLNKIISINQDDFEAYYNLYISYKNENNYTKAKSCWDKAIEINPRYVVAYKGMIRQYVFEEKNYSKALVMIETVIALEPNNPENYVDKSNYLMQTGEYLAALKYAQKAIDLKKDFSPAYVQMAYVYYELNIFLDKALHYLNKAIKLDKKLEPHNRLRHTDMFFDKHILKGKVLAKLNRKEEAKKEFEYVIKNSSLILQSREAKEELYKLNLN